MTFVTDKVAQKYIKYSTVFEISLHKLDLIDSSSSKDFWKSFFGINL